VRKHAKAAPLQARCDTNAPRERANLFENEDDLNPFLQIRPVQHNLPGLS